jgi:hypothetical protein
MSVALDCTSAIRPTREEFKLVPTVAVLVARDTNNAMVAPMAGSDSLCLAGARNLESGGRFMSLRLARRREKFFNLTHYIKKFCKWYTFNATFKDVAAINYITASYKKIVYSRQL